jgi:hypothetical protein
VCQQGRSANKIPIHWHENIKLIGDHSNVEIGPHRAIACALAHAASIRSYAAGEALHQSSVEPNPPHANCSDLSHTFSAARTSRTGGGNDSIEWNQARL